ncbi:hypothetical protein Q9L42_012485 [Methylomarinum sp. Ch1-1]|uniref:Uncharacterized protein n=1 Tax=Methylomarinum roseum TaxID=3067653 RepID=A0AAU7NQD0_9GAMM
MRPDIPSQERRPGANGNVINDVDHHEGHEESTILNRIDESRRVLLNAVKRTKLLGNPDVYC